MIPFAPPRMDQKMIDEVVDTLKSGWITTGPKTMRFEENIAEYTGAKAVVCLNSATAGMHLALHWLGIKEGDEVIVPAYTYCATANVVEHLGGTVVFADVNSDDFNMDVSKLKQLITPKTKAIMPVDISGLPADYIEINKLVNEVKHMFEPSSEVQEKLGRIAVISDAAHSIGATYAGKKTGVWADISSFSFHAVKNLSTAEGGAICLNLPEPFDCDELRKYFKTKSLHGQSKDALAKVQIGAWRYDVVEAGFKCNMTDIQASLGLVELERYQEVLEKRAHIFQRYSEKLSQFEWAHLPVYKTELKESSFHLYLLRINGASETQRDEIIRKISENKVAVNVHYLPVPAMTHYKNMGYDLNDYPVAKANYQNEITLPVFFDLTDDQIDTVVSVLKAAVESTL